MDIFEKILSEFSGRHGFPPLIFNESNVCYIAFEGDITVYVSRDIEKHQLTLITVLEKDLPRPASREWVERALGSALNTMKSRSPGVGYRKGGGVIAYNHLLSMELDLETFEYRLADLILFYQDWHTPSDNTNDEPPASSDDANLENAIFA